MPSGIQIKTPQALLTFEFDWQLEVPDGVTLQDVTHFVPPDLIIVQEEVQQLALLSKVTIAGGKHGRLYVVTASALLSTGETPPGQFTLRVVDPDPLNN
jgi:hypothetical protein